MLFTVVFFPYFSHLSFLFLFCSFHYFFHVYSVFIISRFFIITFSILLSKVSLSDFVTVFISLFIFSFYNWLFDVFSDFISQVFIFCCFIFSPDVCFCNPFLPFCSLFLFFNYSLVCIFIFVNVCSISVSSGHHILCFLFRCPKPQFHVSVTLMLFSLFLMCFFNIFCMLFILLFTGIWIICVSCCLLCKASQYMWFCQSLLSIV